MMKWLPHSPALPTALQTQPHTLPSTAQRRVSCGHLPSIPKPSHLLRHGSCCSWPREDQDVELKNSAGLPALCNMLVLLKSSSAMPKCVQAPCRCENTTTSLLCCWLPKCWLQEGVIVAVATGFVFQAFIFWIPACMLCGTWAPNKLLPGQTECSEKQEQNALKMEK